MADRRPEDQEMSRAKRPKTENLNPETNPYLAHMYEVPVLVNTLRGELIIDSHENQGTALTVIIPTGCPQPWNAA